MNERRRLKKRRESVGEWAERTLITLSDPHSGQPIMGPITVDTLYLIMGYAGQELIELDTLPGAFVKIETKGKYDAARPCM